MERIAAATGFLFALALATSANAALVPLDPTTAACTHFQDGFPPGEAVDGVVEGLGTQTASR